jgi:hypothetical protein
LLGIALAAMIFGCILLLLILNRYGFSTKVTSLMAPPGAVARYTVNTVNPESATEPL